MKYQTALIDFQYIVTEEDPYNKTDYLELIRRANAYDELLAKIEALNIFILKAGYDE